MEVDLLDIVCVEMITFIIGYRFIIGYIIGLL